MTEQSLAAFNRACGLTSPVQLALVHRDNATEFCHLLQQPFALVGRSAAADIVLPEKEVSRRHAFLQVIGGRLFCVDLHSRAGVRWGKIRQSSGWLGAGEKVQIGPYDVTAEGTPPSDAAPHPGAAGAAPPDVSLEFLDSVIQGSGARTWELNRLIAFVGRSPACKVRFSDPSVSDFHCCLVRTTVGVWAVDLLSHAGIAINGARSRWALLEDGDLLKVGRFTIRIHYRKEDQRPTELHPEPRSVGVSPAATQLMPMYGSADAGAFLAGEQTSDALAALASSEHSNIDPLLLAVVNQFSSMQQQMFDQFQQTVWMMVQTFSALQKDQADLIRNELGRLHEVNKELFALHTALRAAPAITEKTPAGDCLAADTTLDKPLAGAAAKGGAGDEALVAAMSATGDVPAEPPNGHATTQRDSGESPKAVEQPNDWSRTDMPQAAPAGAAIAGGERPAEVHSWILNRLDTLEKERQNSWQRIIGFLLQK